MLIAVSGSHGFVGSALCSHLAAKGHTVRRIVRISPAPPHDIFYDPETGCTDTDALEGIDVVIHLAGRNIATRWTPENKFQIYQSRTRTTDILARAITNLKKPPKLFICASAIGFYGDCQDKILTESAFPGNGFLANLCSQWEANCSPIADAGIRVVSLRFGMILDRSGGALAKMLPAFRLGLGAKLGTGRQYQSWVTLEDVVRAVEFIIENHSISGIVNVTSPNPVTNSEFTVALGSALHRPAFFRAPAWLLKLLFRQFATEVLLASTRVIPQKLTSANFHFKHPDLDLALKQILVLYKK